MKTKLQKLKAKQAKALKCLQFGRNVSLDEEDRLCLEIDRLAHEIAAAEDARRKESEKVSERA